MIMPLAAKYGGTHHGTFFRTRARTTSRFGCQLSVAPEYERYRSAVKQDEVALAAWRFLRGNAMRGELRAQLMRPMFERRAFV